MVVMSKAYFKVHFNILCAIIFGLHDQFIWFGVFTGLAVINFIQIIKEERK